MIAPDLAAEALFCSPLQPSDNPSTEQVDAAITAAILLHGADTLAGEVAQEYGDHPDSAPTRMPRGRGAHQPGGCPVITRAFYVESTLDSDGEWGDIELTICLDFVYPPTVEEVAYRIERELLALEPWADRVIELAFAPA